ncbi:MAG: response regulator transcription factor [Bdellovibrionota bacterium]
MARVLVVEDEKDVQELMALHLKREGHSTTTADDGEKALKLLAQEQYDLAVLDWMLPGVSGLDICRSIERKVPVLMVTARADASDIVLGLEVGADDYVTKPFDIPVFLARIRALLRRSELARAGSLRRIQVQGLLIDLDAHEVKKGSEEIKLTVSEFKLLAALVQNRGRVLSREKLIDLVQGEGVIVVDRAIDTHIFGLRKKLGESADLVETIRGVGYRVKT